jgi:membrane-bound lytic murein transglycosylase A
LAPHVAGSALLVLAPCLAFAASAQLALRHPVPHAAVPSVAKKAVHHHASRFGDLGRPPKPDVPGPIRFPDSQIEPQTWSDLDGWAQEDHLAAFNLFRTSCRAVIAHARKNNDARPVAYSLAATCRRALSQPVPNDARAQTFFEDQFRPVRINKLGDGAGFLTGYFEPIVEGSRFPTQIFNIPVYRRPRDLVPPAGATPGAAFPNTGKSMRKLSDGTLVPYYDRGEIDDGALDGERLEICWLKDPIDLFYIQIQGSGRVRLEDGTVLRINYDAHNGYPYTAVGRILIERGIVPRQEMSMERIRQWMMANPADGKELRRANRSYVFFRVVGLSNDGEPSGAQGLPLTPRRSIAVDKALHVYGTPFYIQANLPIASAQPETKFDRIMIAQDTGSAIVGPARADIYYGAGDDAGRVAGRIRHSGNFTLLLPRDLDPVAAGARLPLPPKRPEIIAETKAAQEVIPLPRSRPPIKRGIRTSLRKRA